MLPFFIVLPLITRAWLINNDYNNIPPLTVLKHIPLPNKNKPLNSFIFLRAQQNDNYILV